MKFDSKESDEEDIEEMTDEDEAKKCKHYCYVFKSCF
jgi:hypothetical protein